MLRCGQDRFFAERQRNSSSASSALESVSTSWENALHEFNNSHSVSKTVSPDLIFSDSGPVKSGLPWIVVPRCQVQRPPRAGCSLPCRLHLHRRITRKPRRRSRAGLRRLRRNPNINRTEPHRTLWSEAASSLLQREFRMSGVLGRGLPTAVWTVDRRQGAVQVRSDSSPLSL